MLGGGVIILGILAIHEEGTIIDLAILDEEKIVGIDGGRPVNEILISM